MPLDMAGIIQHDVLYIPTVLNDSLDLWAAGCAVSLQLVLAAWAPEPRLCLRRNSHALGPLLHV